MALTQPTIKLNDSRAIPQLGFGVWQVPKDGAAAAVGSAIAAGYRSIDTAAIYGNEVGVGEAIKASSVPRDQLFVTTKLWNDRHDHDVALKAFDSSLGRLGLDYVDLYLIHWPVPSVGAYVQAWKALIKLRQDGRAKSIGVSNFNPDHLQRIIDETGVVPAVNQVELHPRFQQRSLRQFHAEKGIATEAWSPLGQGQFLEDATIGAIAKKYGKTPAQVIIRWHLDNGVIAIPKSVTPSRIAENLAVFDFHLDADDLAKIATLDDAKGRIGPKPEAF